MASVVRIINLLPIIICEYQQLTLINRLNEFLNFDHNVFLLENSATVEINCFMKNYKSADEYTPQSHYIFGSADDNITGWASHIESKNTLMIVVFDTFDFDSNINLLNKIHRVGSINIKFGVFFLQIISNENLLKLFKWCWEYRLMNIFAATYTEVDQGSEKLMHIFTYNPFGTFDVIDVTGDESLDSWFLTQNPNFQQHQLMFAQEFDKGSSSKPFWSALIHAMNATRVTYNSSYDHNTFMGQRIDVIPIIYGQYEMHNLVMYPLHFFSVIIMVPQAGYYAQFIVYLQTITSDPLFYNSLIVVGVVMLLLSIFRYVKQAKFLIFESVADVINLLMNDNGAIKYQKLSYIELCLIIPLTFAGFIFVNGFGSNFQSYLTRPVQQSQINTMEELYKSHVPILCFDDWWSRAVTWLTNLTKHTEWDRKLIPMGVSALISSAEGFNTSYSYSYLRHLAEQIVDVQKRLNILGFHLPQEDLSKSLCSYLVTNRFPFIERMNNILHLTRSSGLYDYWLVNYKFESKVKYYRLCR